MGGTMIQIHSQKKSNVKYINKNHIESLVELKETEQWQLNMISGDKIIITLDEFLKFNFLGQ